jgi:hypothetical protein
VLPHRALHHPVHLMAALHGQIEHRLPGKRERQKETPPRKGKTKEP